MECGSGNYPKILVVNDVPPDSSLAVANLARQFLLGYPSEQIAWWYWRNFKFVPALPVGTLQRCWLPQRLVPNRRCVGLKGAILERLWVPYAAHHLRRMIASVKPDLIWLVLYGWTILVAHRTGLARNNRLHVSLWDFPDQAGGKRSLGLERSERLLALAYQFVRQAHSCDGICKAMIEEIALQTGRTDSVLVHSGFEPEQLRALENSSPTVPDTLRLAYVGSIISEGSFLNVLAELEEVRLKIPQRVSLEFFARGQHQQPWFNPQWMVGHPACSERELVEKLRAYSWGIVVMDLEGADLRYSRFSFPNKVGTYLSAGVPILGFGDPATSLAEIMQRYRIGTFTSGSQAGLLQKFLLENLTLPQPRSFFRQGILECARREFDSQAMRDHLWQAWGVKRPA